MRSGKKAAVYVFDEVLDTLIERSEKLCLGKVGGLRSYLAEGLLSRHKGAELWYSVWDRFDAAQDASPRLRRRLEELHAEASERADYVFTVSEALARRQPLAMGTTTSSMAMASARRRRATCDARGRDDRRPLLDPRP